MHNLPEVIAILTLSAQTTYLAGCTDPNYEDPSCPSKGDYDDQQWTGLVRCFVNNDTLTDEPWASCEDDEQPLVEKSDLADSCVCEGKTPVFTAGTGLPVFATLPASNGDTMTYLAGMEPSTFEFTSSTANDFSSSTSTKTLSSPATRASITQGGDSTTPTGSLTSTLTSISASTVLATPTLSPTPAATTSTLSTSAKVGIGVGASLGVLSIAGFAILLSWFFRRRKQEQSLVASPSVICCHSRKGSQPSNNGAPSDLKVPSVAWNSHTPELPSAAYTPELPGDQNQLMNYYASNASPTGAHTSNISPNSPYLNTVASSPPIPHTQDGQPRMQAGDRSYGSQQSSPVSTLRGYEQVQQYQPYRPNKYLASGQLSGIAELPDHRRPRNARTEHGTYGLVDGSSEGNARYVSGEWDAGAVQRTGGQHEVHTRHCGAHTRDGVHELPG